MSQSQPTTSVLPRRGLVAARNALRLSQLNVADQLGTTPLTISSWERSITRPSPYFRAHLCQLFGKSAQELDLDEGVEDGTQAILQASAGQ
jgi:transcriptional regulator with XRE-family HTH domain